MRRMILALVLSLPLIAWSAERPPIAGAYGGVGLNASSGSGSVMLDYDACYGDKWWQRCRIHVQAWTDASAPAESQTVTAVYRNRVSTVTITDSTRGTSNVAIGAAWCPEFGPLFGCVGIAYLTEDDTPNIDQHLNANLAAGGTVKGWLVFVQHYSGASEDFIMAGKRFSIK